MAVGGPKILSNLTPISTFTPYVQINHPLLTSMPQEIGKLANRLAARAREVGFSNMHRSARSPRTVDAPSRISSSGPNPPSCSRAQSTYHPSTRNGQRGDKCVHLLWDSHLCQQGGGVYSRRVGQEGAGRSRFRFTFESSHLPPKPVALARSDHPPGGKEATPYF